MHPPLRALAPLRVLALRAVPGYVLLRTLLFVVAAFVGQFAGADAAADLQGPLGVIALAAVLGVVDVRRRGERLLWANLGYPAAVVPALFGCVALAGELALALGRQ